MYIYIYMHVRKTSTHTHTYAGMHAYIHANVLVGKTSTELCTNVVAAGLLEAACPSLEETIESARLKSKISCMRMAGLHARHKVWKLQGTFFANTSPLPTQSHPPQITPGIAKQKGPQSPRAFALQKLRSKHHTP